MINYEALEDMFQDYLEHIAGSEEDELHTAWREASTMVEEKLEAGTLTNEDLGAYELAVARAAFYSGFKISTKGRLFID